jgi:hypothetical protein
MANDATKLTGAAIVVREEDLEDLEKFAGELQGRVDQAHEDGRAFMMAQYVRLLALVRAEAARLRRRFERDTLAAHRRAQRELRKNQRAQEQGA